MGKTESATASRLTVNRVVGLYHEPDRIDIHLDGGWCEGGESVFIDIPDGHDVGSVFVEHRKSSEPRDVLSIGGQA